MHILCVVIAVVYVLGFALAANVYHVFKHENTMLNKHYKALNPNHVMPEPDDALTVVYVYFILFLKWPIVVFEGIKSRID